jgi:Na+/proline symporter
VRHDVSVSAQVGLTAAVIVSQWTWAATLLQSSNVAWQYGVSGPFWYASGASIQILLFGILAIQIKRCAFFLRRSSVVMRPDEL